MMTIPIKNDKDRAFLAAHLQPGDRVKIGNMDEYDEEYCEVCEYEVGIDEYMYEYEFKWITVEKIHQKTFPHSRIPGTAFASEGWFWSTCWVIEYELPFNLRKPAWEVP